MSFDFFTFNSRFFWEDVYNHDGWVIQLNVRTLKYRLVDSLGVKREAGTFAQCKETLLKYIESCELTELKDNTVMILHGFGKNKSSIKMLTKGLRDINANIIPVGYTTLRRGLLYHANILEQMLQNMELKGKLYIINVDAACLITRKLLSESKNYRRFKIESVIDINPTNSGSDLAELLRRKNIFNFLLGPMLKDIATPNAVNLKKLPQEIGHGIIFAPAPWKEVAKKIFARFESFPFSTPPSEHSYAEHVKDIKVKAWNPLDDEKTIKYCKNFITTGDFMKDYKPFASTKVKK